MHKKDILILVTNDDGYQARGFAKLLNIAKEYGEVIAVAPERGQSGMSHSVSLGVALYVNKMADGYYCNGSPVDCVKLAIHELSERKPDLVLSGINHGSNSSVSALYSGTIGAAREACLNGIPSIGFSLSDHSPDADFEASEHFARIIIETALNQNITADTCLNVNIPNISLSEIKGIKTCRQTAGKWVQEFDYKKDEVGNKTYWLGGHFSNFEPEAQDTDEWALTNNYVSIVPINTDNTNYEVLKNVEKWKF